jgi:hypothetical protein
MLFTTIATTASHTSAHGDTTSSSSSQIESLYIYEAFAGLCIVADRQCCFCAALVIFATGVFECNEYQDVYLTPVDLEHGSLEAALRPGETEVSDLKMVGWDELEPALLRQDTVSQLGAAFVCVHKVC